MAAAADHKKQESRLFGVDLAQRCSNFSHEDYLVNAFLGGETRANGKGNNEVLELVGSVSTRASSAHGSEARAFHKKHEIRLFAHCSEARAFHKKHEIRLFGLNLTQHSGNFGHDDHALKVSLGAETLASKKRNNELAEIEGSISKNGNKEMTATEGSTQGSKGRIFPFYDSDALGGQQNAHKNERTAVRSNPILNTVPTTDCFQYRVVG